MGDSGGRKSTTPQTDAEDLLFTDPDQIANQEARNGLLQFDEVERLISIHAPSMTMDFAPDLIRNLNRIAIQGIRRSAGYLRLIPIRITNTPHVPPPPEEVPRLVDEMCVYVREKWSSGADDVQSALHLSAFLMWRLNWIHPFRDGNGRTSRAVSYLVLSVRLGRELIGTPTIADQIVDNKKPYYDALDAADEAWRNGRIDVSVMEKLILHFLVKQLSSAAE